MTEEEKKTRANIVRQRRSTRTRAKPDSTSQTPKAPARSGRGMGRQTGRQPNSPTARQHYHPGSVLLAGNPPTSLRRVKGSVVSSSVPRTGFVPGKGTKGRTTSQRNGGSQRKGYDFAFSFGRTAVHAPGISMPELGTRWVSAGLTVLLGLMLYALSSAGMFKVSAAEVTGNQRMTAEDVTSMLGVLGQPIYKTIPAEIEQDLRTAFSDLSSVKVEVGLPNRVRVTVVERTPVLAWYQGEDKITWIDQNGVAFTPRGDVPGLVLIAANGDPPKLPEDPEKSIYDQAFLTPAMVEAILSISPEIPEGSPMIFDPKYGLGWQDPRGWSVYFGRDTQNISIKKDIYQAILDTISKQGIQPTLVSVAYLDAPFYK
jgi:hypothetical protein